MENTFYTLQAFMTHTEGVSYGLMAVALCFFLVFWLFVSERDDD